ncbi:hypothetical protein NDU88_000640 [Pleurodeles waltl]|uniref:Uncharacterized protein n=1 Tax=Pleurodeles waltl TaxID=8319 RepID=A0AAV7KNW4_PLEWA|nr:hypothetical protein NDU88_000640 [Pleurodeles waltl]
MTRSVGPVEGDAVCPFLFRVLATSFSRLPQGQGYATPSIAGFHPDRCDPREASLVSIKLQGHKCLKTAAVKERTPDGDQAQDAAAVGRCHHMHYSEPCSLAAQFLVSGGQALPLAASGFVLLAPKAVDHGC